MTQLEDKLRAELRGSRVPVYELAHRIWPPDSYPEAWRTPAKGGPPSWVRTMGRAIKRYGLIVTFEGERKMISAPHEWKQDGQNL
jgi:hypothetical protein